MINQLSVKFKSQYYHRTLSIVYKGLCDSEMIYLQYYSLLNGYILQLAACHFSIVQYCNYSSIISRWFNV